MQPSPAQDPATAENDCNRQSISPEAIRTRIMPNSLISENLKATIGQAQRYSLVALSSAVVFAALLLPNPHAGDVIKWELLGIPLSIAPPLALTVLYSVYVGSCLLADNMLIHVGDLVEKLDNIGQTRAVLSYPTILTVSPLGRFFGTMLPAALVVFGLAKVHFQGVYQLPLVVWYFAYVFSALLGVMLYSRVCRYVVPNLYPEKKHNKTSAKKTMQPPNSESFSRTRCLRVD